MRIRITGKQLPKHQTKLEVGANQTGMLGSMVFDPVQNKFVPKLQLQPDPRLGSFNRWWNTTQQTTQAPLNFNTIAPAPPGFIRNDQGSLVADPNFDESTIERPAPDCPAGQTYSELLGRCATPDEISWSQPSEGNRFQDFKKKKRREEFPGFNTAAFGLATLGTIDNIFNQVEVNRKEADRVQQGMTDNKYSSFRNYTPRGYQETNRKLPGSGYTAASFPGRVVAPQFGFAQYGGVLMPGADAPMAMSGMSSVNQPTFVAPENAAPVSTTDAPAPPPAEETAPVTNQPTMESGYVLPLDPYSFKISSKFGTRIHPVTGKRSEHTGLDAGVPVGSSVYTPMNGKVIKVWWDEDYGGGNSVLVEHPDGSRTGYAHLKEAVVKAGDVVTKGQKIALSGNTGKYTTGPHLHFTYRDPSGKKVDPMTVFNFSDFSKGAKKKADKDVAGPNGQISYTHNNPLNLHFGSFAEQYGATKGSPDSDGHVARFPDLQTGLKANMELLFGPSYVNLTIEQARNRWVSGDENTSNASTAAIVKAMGGNKRLKDMSAEERSKLVKEFARWEGKQAYNLIKDMSFQQGGEYELSDQEIQYILANGGQVEYL